jgi:hypothetical protein
MITSHPMRIIVCGTRVLQQAQQVYLNKEVSYVLQQTFSFKKLIDLISVVGCKTRFGFSADATNTYHLIGYPHLLHCLCNIVTFHLKDSIFVRMKKELHLFTLIIIDLDISRLKVFKSFFVRLISFCIEVLVYASPFLSLFRKSNDFFYYNLV